MSVSETYQKLQAKINHMMQAQWGSNMDRTFESKDLRSGGEGLPGNGDHDCKELAQVCNIDVEGDRSGANDVSTLTLHSGPGEYKDGSHANDHGNGREDAIMKDFERKLDQIAIEYQQTLKDYDYNNELTLELEKSRATNDELNRLLKESVAREMETSEELKKKIVEVSKLSSRSEEVFEKERGDFLKELKWKDDCNNELTFELNKSRATIQELNQLLAREKETSEELKKKIVEVSKLSTRLNKEMADLKKKLKEKDDYNKKLTVKLGKSSATIQELKQLAPKLKMKIAEVIRDVSTRKRRETLEKDQLRELIRVKDQLLRTSEQGYEKAKRGFEKEIADLKKRLKEKDDLLIAGGNLGQNREMVKTATAALEDFEMQAQNSTGKLGEKFDQNFTKMNESLQNMNAEIQSLKQKQAGLGVNENLVLMTPLDLQLEIVPEIHAKVEPQAEIASPKSEIATVEFNAEIPEIEPVETETHAQTRKSNCTAEIPEIGPSQNEPQIDEITLKLSASEKLSVFQERFGLTLDEIVQCKRLAFELYSTQGLDKLKEGFLSILTDLSNLKKCGQELLALD